MYFVPDHPTCFVRRVVHLLSPHSLLSFLALSPFSLVPSTLPPSATAAAVAPSSISGGGGSEGDATVAAGAIFCPTARLTLGLSPRLRGAANTTRWPRQAAFSVVRKAPLSFLARPLKVAHFYSRRVETLYFRLQPHPPKAEAGPSCPLRGLLPPAALGGRRSGSGSGGGG